MARRGWRGFTLVELLIVLAVMSLLLTVIVPSMTRAAAIARRTHCQANLKHLGEAFMAYRADLVMGSAKQFTIADQWPTHLSHYLDSNARALLCLEDYSPEAAFEDFQIIRQEINSQPAWDLGLFTTEPVWEQYNMWELEGNAPGIWRLNESQYEAITLAEQKYIVNELPRYEPGDNPDVYYYLVEDLRTGDPNGESWATGDRDYEDIVIRVEELPTGKVSFEMEFGATMYNFDLITEDGTFTSIKGPNRRFEFDGVVEYSYGLNWHADTIQPGQRAILGLDYDADVVYVGTDYTAEHWDQFKAPRHLGKINVVYTSGEVMAFEPNQIDPTDKAIRIAHWNLPGMEK
jgi:prepilin-type N-terminal cleavage/methylation domain-containing protein